MEFLVFVRLSFLFCHFQAREHCLGLLENALRTNYETYYANIPSKMAAADYEPQICATEVESLIFNEQKTAIGYKAAVLRKVNEIKGQTAARDLSPNLVPPDIVGSIFDGNSLDGCKDNNEKKEIGEGKEGGENALKACKKPTFGDSMFETASSLPARSQNLKSEVKALSGIQNERIESLSGILEPLEVATKSVVGSACPINFVVTLESEDSTDCVELQSPDSPAELRSPDSPPDSETSKKHQKNARSSAVQGIKHFDLDENSETRFRRKRNHVELM